MSRKLLFIFSLSIFLLSAAGPVLASSGTVTGYAWSDKIGWVNFGTTNGNAHLSDQVLTGYAWNENYGWVNLGPLESGVKNDGLGTLSGDAWIEGTGWLDFSGVTVDTSTGRFSGTATGDNGVNVSFDCSQCDVSTTWRPYNAGGQGGGGGGGGGTTYQPPSGTIQINDGGPYTNKTAVTLYVTTNAPEMEISNSPDFAGAARVSASVREPWQLPPGDGLKTVYAKFINGQGTESAAVSASVTLDTKPPSVTLNPVSGAYPSGQPVVIGGSTEPFDSVLITIDDRSGQVQADDKGNFVANLGELNQGSHRVSVLATDQAGNQSSAVSASFVVATASPVATPSPTTNGQQPTANSPAPSLTPIPSTPTPNNIPPPMVTVPQEAPPAFRGNVSYLPLQPLSRFVLAPLPDDLRLLVDKLPQLQQTFARVGIAKAADLQKLQGISLALPAVSTLSSLPSGIIFAQTAGGQVDLQNALSLTAQGNVQQTVTTLASSPIKLAYKPEQAASSVRGYIVFQSRNYYHPSFLPDVTSAAAALADAVSGPMAAAPSATGSPADTVSPQINSPAGGALENLQYAIANHLVAGEFDFARQPDGAYAASVQTPSTGGTYQVIALATPQNPGVRHEATGLNLVVDSQGYVYQASGSQETRISNATVTLYWQNPSTGQYEAWPADKFLQENPQITDVTGRYAFLVPKGEYYLKVDAKGYASYTGIPFEMNQGGGIHETVELAPQFSWTKFTWPGIGLLLAAIAVWLIGRWRSRGKPKSFYQSTQYGNDTRDAVHGGYASYAAGGNGDAYRRHP